GTILYDMPTPTPTLSGVCPAHTVITDYSTGVPTIIGLYVPNLVNAGTGSIFDYGNNYTPGVHVLGEHTLIPTPTCLMYPYPVYMLFFNYEEGKFQMGTGLVPGL
ncbi:MAG TPA: hypothetical protein VHA30_04330, partial [Patescibacteria group bacterium]|nr:hypothetical protein [Patescibacteria group bacterium]